MARSHLSTGWTWPLALTAAIAGWSGAPAASGRADEGRPPAVGERAPDFELPDLSGSRRTLLEFTRKGPVVLLVLRGYPGYQCPICHRQVGQYLAAAGKFRQAGATVLMIYPGPADRLQAHAEEFLAGKTLPPHFQILIDPDYTFTGAWKLRWNAPQETAYPSTFVIAPDSTIRFAKISKTHGDRAAPEEALQALSAIQPAKAQPPSRGTSAAEVLQRVRRHAMQPLADGFTRDARLDRHEIADLANDDWRVRTLAIRDLVRSGADAVPVLLASLEDENVHVRQVCALVLEILPADWFPAEWASARLSKLAVRLKDDPNPVVRSEAAIALGRIGDASSAATLRLAAEQDASRDVRHQAALALNRLGRGPQVWDGSLLEAYRDLDESTFHKLTVGAAAIDFTLRDTEGRPWRLADFLGKKPVVLIWIFADWCPVCHGEFRELVQLQRECAENGIEVATIQCHELWRCRVMAGQEPAPPYWFAKEAPQQAYAHRRWWPHLSDPAGAVGAMYGVCPLAFAVHAEYIHRPATVIIDKEGVVRFAYYGTYWGDRPTIRQTLDMVRSGTFSFAHPQRLHAVP